MRILVTGSRGLIGTALCGLLRNEGHELVCAVRVPHGQPGIAPPEAGPGQLLWDTVGGFSRPEALEGVHAVVHLAGENVAGSWTRRKMDEIYDSRVVGTRTLCETLAAMRQKPEVLICASGVGYYGSQGDVALDEEHPSGAGFLATVAFDTERVAGIAQRAGIRTVLARFGTVLSTRGGALARMLPAFRAGMGGRMGSGRQYWSWIALEDATGALRFILAHPALHGPVNVVTPNPVTNDEFTRTLGETLDRPALLTVPSLILRLAIGRMAAEVLLASMRVIPRKLVENGFLFRFPYLQDAL